MEQRAKDDAQNLNSKERAMENEGGLQDTSADNNQGKPAPADREEGSLEHGELGGNFNDANPEKEE